MKKSKYGFPLCIQLTLPERFPGNQEWEKTLTLLQEHAFYGVELNITDFIRTDPVRLKEQLDSYGLKMTYLASGAYAKKECLSLSAKEGIRRRSVECFRILLDFAREMQSGIICGFIKGSAERNSISKEQLNRSLAELRQMNADYQIPILIEATNHYEAALANTLSEAFSFVKGNKKEEPGCLQILPDTYHMNIEESSIAGAMIQYADFFQNFHISDNNRYYPGFGQIDFFQIFRVLKGMKYQGTLAIEGRNSLSLHEDIIFSAKYLSVIGEKLQSDLLRENQ